MTTRARTTLALIVVILGIVGVGLFLVVRPGSDDTPTSDFARDAASREVPALLEASTTGEAKENELPTLKGRAVPEYDDRIPRGVRVVVRSKGGIRIPGAGVVATWTGKDDVPQTVEAVTTSDGSVFLADVPRDGSARISVRAHARNHLSTGGDEIQVTAAELVATIPQGLPLHVRCVDDLTGREIREAVVRGTRPRPTPGDGIPDGDGWILALNSANTSSTVEFHVDAPPGFVAWDPTRFHASIGAWTKELEVVYPLRHEVEVRVSVLDHEGVPEGRAMIEAIHIAGGRVPARRAERVGPGAFRLRGVPFFRYAALVVTAYATYYGGSATRHVRLGAYPTDLVELTITLPPPGGEETVHDSLIGIGGGAGGAFGGRGGLHHRGDALIEVLRHDGSPASGVQVKVGRQTVRTDAEGRARAVNLPVGDQKVIVHAIGFLPLEGTIRIVADRVTELTLREPEGGAIDVHVRDAHGDPLPFATLTVKMPSKGAWVDEQDGRQRIDPFTDHFGYRRLDRAESGTIEIQAEWEGRKASTTVTVSEGLSTAVTIVIE